jgi:hypothetical protein
MVLSKRNHRIAVGRLLLPLHFSPPQEIFSVRFEDFNLLSTTVAHQKRKNGIDLERSQHIDRIHFVEKRQEFWNELSLDAKNDRRK